MCGLQISARHTFRLFQVLEAVIAASDSLEETWEKTFTQLALENMTKNTVGPLPLQGVHVVATGDPWRLWMCAEFRGLAWDLCPLLCPNHHPPGKQCHALRGGRRGCSKDPVGVASPEAPLLHPIPAPGRSAVGVAWSPGCTQSWMPIYVSLKKTNRVPPSHPQPAIPGATPAQARVWQPPGLKLTVP